MPTTPVLDPAVRGNQSKGHARWARAKQWAEANPTHKNAIKYFKRAAAADEMERRMPGMQWLHFHGHGGYAGQTCSTRCAILKMQVDLQADGLEALDEALKDPYTKYGYRKPFVQERPASSPRKGKCQTCDGTVVAR